jgi:hypothetical protein
LRAQFVDKRIDAQVVDKIDLLQLAQSSQRAGTLLKGKQLALAGRKGHIKLLSAPLAKGQNTGFTAKDGTTASFPLAALRPCREDTVGMPIAHISGCRVIIIGPDVFGSAASVGEYAEVLPGATQFPDVVVRVKFEYRFNSFNELERREADYHLVCLCLATNIQYAHLPPTVFEARP